MSELDIVTAEVVLVEVVSVVDTLEVVSVVDAVKDAVDVVKGVVDAVDVVKDVVDVVDVVKGVVDVVDAVKDTVDVVKDTVDKSKDVSSVVIEALKNNNYINDIITNKLVLKISENDNNKLMNILKFIYTETNSKTHLITILKNIEGVFVDGKIDIFDVPLIIEIITNFFNMNNELINNIKINNIKINNITIEDIALCIKILLIVFIELKIINNDMNTELSTILKLVDNSLNLLKLNVFIKKNNCLNIFNCCKK